VARDQTGLKELGTIAGDNGADDTLRTEAATAFARLASSKPDVDVLLVLSKKYLEESAKRTAEALKLKPDFDKAEAAQADAKKASDEAKTAAQQAAKNTAMSAADFKAVAAKAQAAEDAYKEAKKKHNVAVSPYNGKMNDAKGYKQFARMFQTHAARIEVAIRCGKDPKCFVDTLKETDEDAVKHVQGYVKDEKGNEEDLSKWTKEEKLGLREGEIERAMLEIGKMGQAASSFTNPLLDAVKSDDRIIRQSIMLALPKIAKVPCDNCEEKLAAAVTAGEGKVTLGDLNVETTMLRNYFAWAGGRTPTKAKKAEAPAAGSDAAKPDDGAKKDETPAEKPADPTPAKAADPTPEKAADPAPAKADPPKKGAKTPPAKTPPKKGHR
jgi:hypothetical protein